MISAALAVPPLVSTTTGRFGHGCGFASRYVLDVVGARPLVPDPAHLELYRAAGLAAQLLHGLIVLPAFGRATVQGDDLIARLNPRPLRGRVGERRHDGDPPVSNVDLDAQTAVVAGRRFVQRPEVVALEEDRIRIVQLVEHAVDRHLVEPPLLDRVHVEVGDVSEHVLEQTRLLVNGPRGLGLALQQPAPGGQRQAGRRADDHDIPELHETPRVESAVTAMTSRQAASCTAFLDCVASTCTTPGPAARRYASSTRR